jgi:two-component system OmpR family sensor kinase
MLEPLMSLPEGQAAYSAALRRAAATIALIDLPLVVIVAVAAYVLARVSIRPLVAAREREERFAADAAHELRTPLATIAGLAQAARGAGGVEQGRALERITTIALEASGLLGDLLTLMRDAPDDRRLHEPVDLGALLAAVVRDPPPAPAGIALALSLPPDGAFVIGDERALRTLATNLIVNASRHARSRVDVSVAADAQTIALAVEDDGPGVAPADRERVFERFFKAQANAPGSGLGLAICRHIAARHSGSVVLEKRARFVARFPRAPQ